MSEKLNINSGFLNKVLDGVNFVKKIQIGEVVDITDPNGLGRIKVRIPGMAIRGGDGNNLESNKEDLSWCSPMIPKFFQSVPKINEAVFVFTLSDQKQFEDRLYLGPIISELKRIEKDPINSALTILNAGPLADINKDLIQQLNGVYPKQDDIAIQGRNNTDIILRKNEILIRAGKFIETNENSYGIRFNTTTTQGFIQIKNNVNLNENNTGEVGSVLNIVGTKINLISKFGSPNYPTLINSESQISDTQTLEILKTAHPVPFGDKLLEYLILFKNAFLNHVHNKDFPTDLVVGGLASYVSQFAKRASEIEREMLSNNIRIN